MDSERLKRAVENMTSVPPIGVGASRRWSSWPVQQVAEVHRVMASLEASGVPPSEVERIGWFAMTQPEPKDAIRVIASRYWRGDFSPIEDMHRTYEYERLRSRLP